MAAGPGHPVRLLREHSPARRGRRSGAALRSSGAGSPAPPPPSSPPSRPRRGGVAREPPEPRARLRQEQRPRRGAGGAEPGPPGTPERPARNTTRAGSGDGSDGRVRTMSHVPRPRGYGVPRVGQAGRARCEISAPTFPEAPLAAMLPPSLPPSVPGQPWQERPREQKGNLASCRLPWVLPPPSRTQDLCRDTRASPHSPREYKSPAALRRTGAAPWWVSGSPSPSVMKRTSPASARRSGSRRLSRPWPSVSGPPPPPSGAHGREEHFPGGSTRLGELFRSERAIPWANRKLARAWRARRNQRVTRSPRRRRARERSELKREPGGLPRRKQSAGAVRTPEPEHENTGRSWEKATP